MSFWSYCCYFERTMLSTKTYRATSILFDLTYNVGTVSELPSGVYFESVFFYLLPRVVCSIDYLHVIGQRLESFDQPFVCLLYRLFVCLLFVRPLAHARTRTHDRPHSPALARTHSHSPAFARTSPLARSHAFPHANRSLTRLLANERPD